MVWEKTQLVHLDFYGAAILLYNVQNAVWFGIISLS